MTINSRTATTGSVENPIASADLSRVTSLELKNENRGPPAKHSAIYIWQITVPPIGTTYEIDVGSNDIFLFQDDSWGASRSKPANHNYTKTITLNPTPRTARASVKWYQMVGNNADLGALMNSINAGTVEYRQHFQCKGQSRPV